MFRSFKWYRSRKLNSKVTEDYGSIFVTFCLIFAKVNYAHKYSHIKLLAQHDRCCLEFCICPDRSESGMLWNSEHLNEVVLSILAMFVTLTYYFENDLAHVFILCSKAMAALLNDIWSIHNMYIKLATAIGCKITKKCIFINTHDQWSYHNCHQYVDSCFRSHQSSLCIAMNMQIGVFA